MLLCVQLEQYFELLEAEIERELGGDTTTSVPQSPSSPSSCQLINRLRMERLFDGRDKDQSHATLALREAKTRIEADAASRKFG